MPPISAWLKPRSRWVAWPLLILALVASFGAGGVVALQFGPQRVEERTEFIEVKRKERKKVKTQDVKTYVKIVKLPDGTETTERSTIALTKVDTTEKLETMTRAATETITTNKPNWRLGVLIGAQLVGQPALPIAGPLVLGATGEVRLGGSPFFLGAWGTTAGTVGISGTAELP